MLQRYNIIDIKNLINKYKRVLLGAVSILLLTTLLILNSSRFQTSLANSIADQINNQSVINMLEAIRQFSKKTNT